VSTPKTSTKCLGLLAGLGPAATVDYYMRLLAAFAKREVTPRIVMSHAEANVVRELVDAADVDRLAAYLAEHVRIVARAGADFAAIPAVAPHICAAELERQTPIPLIDVISEFGGELKRQGLSRIGMLGSRWVMESRFYDRLKDVELVPLAANEIAVVHDIYMSFVTNARASQAEIEELRSIAKRAIARDKLQAIALAGTDLAVAFGEATAGFPAIDCARVHIDAIVKAMME
jgi:aspartate racemase